MPSTSFGTDQRRRAIRRLTLTVAAAVLCAIGVMHAQRGDGAGKPPDVTPPPDVAAPPADGIKTSSGLVSKVLKPAVGSEKPIPTDVVTLNYTGWTSSGDLVDSSLSREKPAMFPLDKTGLPGWKECVLLMAIGEKRRCWIPEKLAYAGAKGRPKGMLVFDIELLDIHGSPLVAPPDVAAPPADARKTPSGLAFKVLRVGSGVRNPSPNNRVIVHYTGWTTNGKMFDSSIPRGEPMRLGLNDVIPGWSEGLTLMVVGERTRFWIPQELAYKGAQGSPRGMLVFDVELIRIE